jgi:hypothetical protein
MMEVFKAGGRVVKKAFSRKGALQHQNREPVGL